MTPLETTPGGSRVFRYALDEEESLYRNIDHLAGRTESTRSLLASYRTWFPSGKLYVEGGGLVPHVDIVVFPPNEKRDFFTLVTAGMSEQRMQGREGREPPKSRAELVLYAEDFREEYLRFLGALSHIPHDLKTFFAEAHTIPNGNPPAPWFTDSLLSHALFMNSPQTPEKHGLEIHGERLQFLMVVPITAPECQLKLDRGALALLDAFAAAKESPYVLWPHRESLI